MTYENMDNFVEMIRAIQTKDDNDVLIGTTGRRGCQPKGSKVLMADGELKNIEDIKQGDLVLSPQEDGSHMYSKVLETTQWDCKENYDVIDINRKKRYLYSCSYNHLIPIFHNKRINHFTAKQCFKKYNSYKDNLIHTFSIQKFHNSLLPSELVYKKIEIGIEKAKPEMVYGFKLDSISNWYITDNWCITHNSGKSSLSIQIARAYVKKYFGENTFDINKYMAFNNDDVMERIHSLPMYSPLIGDEAIRFLWSREWNRAENKELAKLTTQIRTKKLIFFMNIPKLAWIDSMFREGMLDIWIWVHATFTDKGKESHALVFEPDDNQGQGDSWHMDVLRKYSKRKRERIGRFTSIDRVYKMIQNHPCFVDTFRFPKVPQDLYERYLAIRNERAFERAGEYANQKDVAKVMSYNLKYNWDKITEAVNSSKFKIPTNKLISDILTHDPTREKVMVSEGIMRKWISDVDKVIPEDKKKSAPKQVGQKVEKKLPEIVKSTMVMTEEAEQKEKKDMEFPPLFSPKKDMNLNT